MADCDGNATFDDILPNLQGLIFAEAQAGYVAGVLACSISESGVIGAIGGIFAIPPVPQYIGGYHNEIGLIVNDPRATSPYNRTFTVQYLGNVVGGDLVKYLNVEIDVMKSIAQQSIMAGEPVWFGCDVGKMMRRDMGIWDKNLYDFDNLYDTTFTLNKEQRLVAHQTLMTHAMLFTGVDVVHDRPRRWRVENSWGEENSGRKGFYVMNDSWFDEHMFEIAAPKKYLSKELLAALDQPPIVLPAWDPMGALAG